MGVLDDAIRDHLDLKRRRGADPAEIAQAERDALGPVRRGPEPVADEAPVADALPVDDVEVGAPPFEEGPAGELADDELWADELEPEWEDEPVEELPPLAFDPAPRAAEAPAPPVPDPGLSPAIPEPHPAPPATTGGETVEYRVEDALDPEDPLGHDDPLAPEDRLGHEDPLGPEDRLGHKDPLPHEGGEGTEGRGDDVLEETPEFLQDTPDHDRLWFEQRPPRDFDFDG